MSRCLLAQLWAEDRLRPDCARGDERGRIAGDRVRCRIVEAVFVKAAKQEACVELPPNLVLEGMAEFQRLTSLDNILPTLVFRETCQV